MSDENLILEMDLAVALSALRKMRRLMEDNATSDKPDDAAILRQSYSLMLDASAGVAGAHAVVKTRRELADTLAPPPALRRALRVVK